MEKKAIITRDTNFSWMRSNLMISVEKWNSINSEARQNGTVQSTPDNVNE
jgi:hypothetical protein